MTFCLLSCALIDMTLLKMGLLCSFASCLYSYIFLCPFCFFLYFFILSSTDNPLYTDTRYNGKMRYKALRKHAYSNILKILPPKNENFQMKNSDIFHISAQNIDCGYSLEPPRRGGSNEYPQSMFFLTK